jgi:hypothetical protein
MTKVLLYSTLLCFVISFTVANSFVVFIHYRIGFPAFLNKFMNFIIWNKSLPVFFFFFCITRPTQTWVLPVLINYTWMLSQLKDKYGDIGFVNIINLICIGAGVCFCIRFHLLILRRRIWKDSWRVWLNFKADK